MGSLDPNPQFLPTDRGANLTAALDEPFSLTTNLSEQTQNAALSTFGLGTVARDWMTPRGAEGPNPIGQGLQASPITGPLANAYEALRSSFGAQDSGQLLGKDAYRQSPYFRDAVPWDAGMTVDRAASLAAQADIKATREYFAQKRPISSFIAGFAGQALDPINYIPIGGELAIAGATARLGEIGGRLLVGASEAAINTAVFGTLTASIRAKYGDDVSWQSMVTDIGMSALIGGAFAGGGMALGAALRGLKGVPLARIAAEKDRLATLANDQGARVSMNEAVGTFIENGEVRMGPNGMDPIERLAGEVTGRTDAGRALDAETRGIAAGAHGEVVTSPSGARLQVKPEVVELSSLVHAGGALQVRDRSTVASAAQVERIATQLDPARLMPNTDASQGAPLVGADNIIDSGNGRVMALRRVYENPDYAPQRDRYKQALVDAGHPEAAGMAQPVLIQRRVTDLSPEARVQFNREVNLPTTAQLSAVELAAMDRSALDEPTLALHADGDVTSVANKPFVRRFLANIDENSRAVLSDGADRLTADGKRRVENALVAAAYGDVDAGVIRRFAEATDDNSRSIVGAMSDVAGRWANMRRAVKAGDISPEFDQTAELTNALRLLGGWREQAAREGIPVSAAIRDGMAQLDFLDGGVSPETQVFVHMFYRDGHFGTAVGRETLGARLRDVLAATEELGKPQLFADIMPTKIEVLRNATRNDVETDVFAPPGFEPGAQEIGAAGSGPTAGADGGGNRQGAGVDTSAPTDPVERAQAGEQAFSGVPGLLARDRAQADLNTAKAAAPDVTLDQLYEVAPAHQQELGDAGRALAEANGARFKDPGLKGKGTAAQKMIRKGYRSVGEMTDIIRGGFVVKMPGDADRIVEGLARQFHTIDEGWNVTDAGYFDRKVLVVFHDGTIGEVQFWHPEMLKAKSEAGHALYEEMRQLPKDDPRRSELLDAQRRVYSEAMASADPSWRPLVGELDRELADASTPAGRPADGNNESNRASETMYPESTISEGSASAQALDPLGTNQAEPELPMMAGRPSQLKNLSTLEPRDVGPMNAIQATPDPAPEGLGEAAGRVGKPEDMRQLAEQHGVDLATGDFPELADVEQMRKDGRLSPEDEAELTAAQETFDMAEAYGNTVKAALNCIL